MWNPPEGTKPNSPTARSGAQTWSPRRRETTGCSASSLPPERHHFWWKLEGGWQSEHGQRQAERTGKHSQSKFLRGVGVGFLCGVGRGQSRTGLYAPPVPSSTSPFSSPFLCHSSASFPIPNISVSTGLLTMQPQVKWVGPSRGNSGNKLCRSGYDKQLRKESGWVCQKLFSAFNK